MTHTTLPRGTQKYNLHLQDPKTTPVSNLDSSGVSAQLARNKAAAAEILKQALASLDSNYTQATIGKTKFLVR